MFLSMRTSYAHDILVSFIIHNVMFVSNYDKAELAFNCTTLYMFRARALQPFLSESEYAAACALGPAVPSQFADA